MDDTDGMSSMNGTDGTDGIDGIGGMDEQKTTTPRSEAGPEADPEAGPGTEAGAAPGQTSRIPYRLYLGTAVLLILSGLVHLVVFAVDGGPWDAPVSWRKPVTFGLSFGVTLLAVVKVTSYVRVGPRLRTALLGVFAVDCVVEVGGITLQAWRGVPSHLDMETPFDTAVSMVLAVGGGVLVVLLTVFAVASFRHRPTGPAGMALAVRSGFAILLVALASGAAMIARGVVLTRAGHQEAAYHSTAPFKPLHGVSLHAVVVLPLLAWLLSRTSWSESVRWRIVAAVVGCYAVAVAAAGAWAVWAVLTS
ncbi:hypothetical protein SAMN04487983_102617 [Streptomyces sp. yr375]|uniref:hypothetical protein n=1 Tax=Streptomyces sp. yr375 TaxID=1761906 RepID=UPI0008D61346|nr:hypothetical protein [Streptomyces sp. yr375]SER95901.1 hypothetical protein SAMN04487983_102617 [Streptomyces sp. yr375]